MQAIKELSSFFNTVRQAIFRFKPNGFDFRKARHYLDKEIEEDAINGLKAAINEACQDSGLDVQLVLNEPRAFTGFLAKYGKFENCKNYITICGKKDREVDGG